MNALNRSCEEVRLFGRQVLSDDNEVIIRYVVLGFNLLLYPLSISITALPIYLIAKFKHLHQITFFLALQLLILDLIFETNVRCTSFISAPAGQWLLGLPMCSINGGIVAFSFQLKNWLMFVFVCDRFLTVFMPFNYRDKVRRRVISIFCPVVVMLSLFGSISSAVFGCNGFQRTISSCVNTPNSECPHHKYCQVHIIVEITAGQLFGSYIPLVMYIALFIKAKKIRNRQLNSQIDTQEKAQQRSRDNRANITFFTIFVSLFVVPCPSLWSYNIIVMLNQESTSSEFLVVLTSLVQQLYALLPIADSIAIMRNPEVRKALKMFRDKTMIYCIMCKESKNTR